MTQGQLNSEFSGYHNKVKEPNLPYYLTIASGENSQIYTVPKGISTEIQTILSRFEHKSLSPFPQPSTVMTQAPPYVLTQPSPP